MIERRTRTAKHFALPDGREVAVIAAAPVHYQDMNGAWQDIDLAFHRDAGGDDLADRNAFVVRSDAWGLAFTDWWGRGILWLMPQPPTVDGGSATVANEGVLWSYVLTPTALKAEALVTASRGPQTYRFLYYTIGGADEFTIDTDGNAVIADVAVVPRAFAVGANGATYSAGTWEVGGEGTLQFTFDDSGLPAEAYPYRLDPTTQATTTDAGYIWGMSTDYSTARSTAYKTTVDGTIQVGQRFASRYFTYRGFLEFDTGSIPGDAVVQSVTLKAALGATYNEPAFQVQVRELNWSTPLVDNAVDDASYDACLAAPAGPLWVDTSQALPPLTYLPSAPLSTAWIAKGGRGRTRYCLISNRDAAATPPTNQSYLYTNSGQPPLLEVVYSGAAVVYFDGAEAGSDGDGINSAAHECLGYSATNCGTGPSVLGAQPRSGRAIYRCVSTAAAAGRRRQTCVPR